MPQADFQAQKTLASFLDRASDRCSNGGASSRQCWFLSGLILKAGETGGEYITNTSLCLTKGYASILIDEYLKG